MIVVADTSILINLCRVKRDGLLKPLFQEVIIPSDVAREFNRLATSTARFSGLKLPEGIRQQEPITIAPAVRLAVGLDAGEAAALSLAIEIKADAILLDERRGHQVATALGLRTIGILGILLQAKSAGILPAVGPILDDLERDAGFWISAPLRQRVLQLADES